MNKRICLIVLLSVLILSSYSQGCFGPTSDELIQTGNVEIVNPVRGGRQTTTQTAILYKIPSWGFRSAFSFLSLQYNTTLGLDFNIRGGRIDNTNFLGISLLLLQDQRWQRFKVTYFVSSRKDFWLGTFMASPYQLSGVQNFAGTQSPQISGPVHSWDGNSSAVYFSRVFLSGLGTGNSNFGILFANVTFDKVRGIISLNVVNGTKGIDLIAVSYVIFINPHPRFTFQNSVNLIDTPTDYSLEGSYGFSQNGLTGAKYEEIAFFSKLINCKSCTNPCIPKDDCTAAQGTITGKDCTVPCPIQQIYNPVSKTCVCQAPRVLRNGKCQCPNNLRWNATSKSCFCLPTFQLYNETSNSCVCATGFVRLTTGECGLICKVNQIWNGSACVCASGFVRIAGICGKCPAGTLYNSTTSTCVNICKVNEVYNTTTAKCDCSPGFNRIAGVCGQCKAGQNYNAQAQTCNPPCKINESWNGTACVCTSKLFDANGNCVQCALNFYYDPTLKVCVPQPTCPTGAQWNQTQLKCVCTKAGQYLIAGKCQPCGANSQWKDPSCVCKAGFYLIGTECLTCDINSSYNAILKNCVCNRGYFGDRLKCEKCHPTCGRCTGVNSNQCTECIDLTYTLSNGVCTKIPGTCPLGNYLEGTVCKPCQSYCQTCRNSTYCNKCTTGFQLVVASVSNYVCSQICGDGIRFQLACDDGNKNNGDGCNDKCTVEPGWTCSGGTPTTKSNCFNIIPGRTIITPKGEVLGTGVVYKGITLSYLPANLTAGGCPKCSQLLSISIVQAQLIPTIKVTYVPTTLYKYLVEFNFNGVFGIPPFSYTVKINPAYTQYFKAEDMAQILQLEIDPAVLSTYEPQGQQALGFQEIQGTGIESQLDQRIFQ